MPIARCPFDAKNRWKLADYCVRAIEKLLSAGGRLPHEEFHVVFRVWVCASIFRFVDILNGWTRLFRVIQFAKPIAAIESCSDCMFRYRKTWLGIGTEAFYRVQNSTREKKANAYAIDWVDTRQWRRRRSIGTRIPYSFHFSNQVCVCACVVEAACQSLDCVGSERGTVISSFRFHLNLNRFDFIFFSIFVFLLCSRLDNANMEAQWNVRFTIVPRRRRKKLNTWMCLVLNAIVSARK